MKATWIIPTNTGLATVIAALGWALPAGVEAADDLSPDQVAFFESKIRPVLAESCYECHNSIDKKKGGVALDYREALLESDVIVPGDPEASLLMASILHEEGFEPMPSKAPKLSKLTLSHFDEWIRMGAPDPRVEKPTKEDLASQVDWNAVRDKRKEWWSFQPIANPSVPDAMAPGWDDTPIDRFLYRELAKEGIAPQEKADPAVLARRLHLILIGLPPEPDVVEAFVAAPTQEAYESLVDDLLASEAFGERWGRYWLDWFRYAESHGSEGDPPVPYAAAYRDYVIRALNADVPYDQLLREAVAGDLLPEPRINEELGLNESAIGPAHFRMVPHGFGVTDAYEEQITFIDNQIDVLTKATMGMTLSCSRCHNHKFDPLSQADFYKFYGIMVSSRPGVVNIDSPDLKQLHREALAELKPEIGQDIAEFWLGQVDQAIERLESADSSVLNKDVAKVESHPLHAWVHLGRLKPEAVARQWDALRQRHEERLHQRGQRIAKATYYADLREQETYDAWFRHGTGLAGGQVAPAGAFAIAGEGDKALTGVYPRGVYSHLLTDRSNATLSSVFHQAQGKTAAVYGIGHNAASRLTVRSYPLVHGGLHPAPEFKPSWGWVNQKKYAYWNNEQLYFHLTTSPDQTVKPKTGRAWFGVTEVYGGDEPLPDVGAPAMALPGAPNAIEDREHLLAFYKEQLTTALRLWPTGEISDEQARLIDAFRQYELLPNALGAFPEPLRERLAAYRRLENEIRDPVRAPGLIEGQPWDQPLLVQGSHKEEEAPVERGFLEVFDGRTYGKETSGRLELAEDLVSPTNTLTSRVIVNRLWHHTFGRGLVASADNFGRLGKPPSHPELLDYLATQFRDEDDWSIKTLLRRLVTSRAFQSSSEAAAGTETKDPENLLLSYFTPRRLDAEAIKDTLRFVSGTLDSRAVYQSQRRNNLDPFLSAFNLPIPTTTVGVRNSTNVPAQALMLLNNPEVNQSANRWRDRLMQERGLETDEQRIERLFMQAYSRKPSEKELQACLAFLEGKAAGADGDRFSAQVDELRGELASLQARRRSLIKETRDRLQAEVDKRNAEARKEAHVEIVDLAPIAHWDFESGVVDRVGGLGAEITGNARVEGGALVLEGGCLITKPLSQDLEAKTMEVLVELDRLDQRGGGAMTVQTLDGNTFDSVCYAEITGNEWLTGSNHHARTLPFQGNREEKPGERVRMILTYAKDGTTRAFRNGKPYGEPIRKAPLQTFTAGDVQIAFGLRHGRGPGGNRMLTGRIHEARLYDRVLSPDEVVAAGAGSWVNYALGSRNPNVPGFVVLRSEKSAIPHGGVSIFGNAFLPATNQGSIFNISGDQAVPNIRPAMLKGEQRRSLDLISQLDLGFAEKVAAKDAVVASIENAETAFLMQEAVPDLTDISKESKATRDLYGIDDPDQQKAEYAKQCLIARRLVESGVRFVELSCCAYNIGGGNGGNPWDQHGNIKEGHGKMAAQIDQPIAALIQDLKQRGLFEDTLVVFTGEFGRTPFAQGNNGRDHDPFGFSSWLAGGGVKGGTVYGATDEFGYRAVDKVATVYDLWATVLHQLGINHEKLTYRWGGRDLRLTDVHGHVWKDILA